MNESSKILASGGHSLSQDGASQDGLSQDCRVSRVADSKAIRLVTLMMTSWVITACQPTPPDHREMVTLPLYDGGDVVRGEQLYVDNCLQCHKLQAGSNKKGPQLIGIYGAPAAALADYEYTAAMTNSRWTWDASTLDEFIKDPIAVMPDTRMLSDPVPNAQDRQDMIAYLSTLGRASSADANDDTNPSDNISDSGS